MKKYTIHNSQTTHHWNSIQSHRQNMSRRNIKTAILKLMANAVTSTMNKTFQL